MSGTVEDNSANSAGVGRISEIDEGTWANLQAACDGVNAELRKVRRRLAAVTALGATIAVLIYGSMRGAGEYDPERLFVPFGVVLIYAAYEVRNLARRHKHTVVRQIVQTMGHGLTYSPLSVFSKRDFLATDLFRGGIDGWTAEDEIRGRKNAVRYSILEGRASRHCDGETEVVFQGLIVRLDFNERFRGHTVVVPETAVFGLLGPRLRWSDKDIARMDDPRFEHHYTVYTTDQQQCRYILTPKMKELILKVRELLRVSVRLSFRDNAVVIAIPQRANRFEVPRLLTAVSPIDVALELAEVVRIAERLVDTLELETRICRNGEPRAQ